MEILEVVKWIFTSVMIPIGAVFTFLKIFFDKWLDNRFRTVSDANRQDHEKELIRMRLLINNELSRSRFIGVKQFDVVSDLWSSIMESFWSAQHVLNPLHQSPDMRYYSTEDRNEYLADIDAPGWLCRKLEESAANDDYNKMNRDLFQFLQATKLTDALNKSAVAYRELDKVGILLPIELHDRYRSFLNLIHDALVEKQSADQLNLLGPDYRKRRDLFQNDSSRDREDLLVRTRAFLVEARTS